MQTNWEKFNPEKYVEDNYSYIHDEDRQIISLVVDYLQEIKPNIRHALEVGVGPNLYPLIELLPYVENVECMEYSRRNIEYLKKQLQQPNDNWNTFHKHLQSMNGLYTFSLRETLLQKVKIRQGSIYNLPENKYKLGSMNFVAESITDNVENFEIVCRKFYSSVERGGYLIASFMENSRGYEIDGVPFPAYPVNVDKLNKLFSPVTLALKIHRIRRSDSPLRPSYTGMLLITATKA